MPVLAPSLARLRADIDARWAHRDRSSDGWIGDADHSSRVSDHNPDEHGVVHALDVDVDGINVAEVLRAVIGDPRVWYVIHNRTIWSRTYSWEPLAYIGRNPHTTHLHVSIRYDREAENNTAAWLSGGRRPRSTRLPVVDLSNTQRQARADETKVHPGVKQVQRQLNDRLRLSGRQALRVDGHYGDRTLEAMKMYQRRLGRLGARTAKVTGVPNRTDLERLGRGVFRVRK